MSQPYDHPYAFDPNTLSPPPPPSSEPRPPLRGQGRRRTVTILISTLALIALVIGAGCFAANAITGATTRHSALILTATPTALGFYATVTPLPGAKPTPTVGPHTPTPPPVVVYVTGTPRPPYPTYTPQRPYPTYTPLPGATSTPTPHPILTLDDPLASHANQDPSDGWSQGGIENGTQAVMDQTTNAQDGFVWHLSHIRTATVTAYYCLKPTASGPPDCGVAEPVVQDMTFICSSDAVTWSNCAVTGRTQDWASTPQNGTSPYWQYVIWTLAAPENTNYLEARIGANYPVPFGFGEGDFQYQP